MHFCILFVLGRKKGNRNTWMLLLSNIGFSYVFEYFVLNLFRGYTYKPSVMKNRYFDNIFGAILSQALFVPIAATFLTVFEKTWSWKFGFAFFYYLIENLFLKLNIYTVNWWRPIYTLVLINVFFFISDSFYKLLINRREFALKITHYLSIDVIGITLMYITAVRRKVRFGRGWFHSWREHFIIAPLYSFFLSFIAIFISSKRGFFYRFLQLLINACLDLTLKWKGILKMNMIHWFENIFFHSFMVFISRSLYNFTHKYS